MSNIILIGMPGAGKSTVGVLLAKSLSKNFIDTDLLIQMRHRKSLQGIIDRFGYVTLRGMEEEVILSLDTDNTVIATGGSAVYSDQAMRHLKETGTIVYLDAEIKELLRRLGNYSMRGIAKAKEQSFEELYAERTRLYKKFADSTITVTAKTHERIVAEIIGSSGG